MKILVVDNNTKHKNEIQQMLKGFGVTEIAYRPGALLDWQNFDLVVLSGGGGEGLEINDTDHRGRLWYQDQIHLVRQCKKPIIGICMGFEVICKAFQENVDEMDQTVRGFKNINITEGGKNFLPHNNIQQYEAHRWRVKKVSKNDFEVLAESEYGVEMIKHRRLPIVATQFHPEVAGGTLRFSDILASL